MTLAGNSNGTTIENVLVILGESTNVTDTPAGKYGAVEDHS